MNFLNSNLQTGITEMIIYLIMKKALGKAQVFIEHTVDCNCDTFGQDVAIRANKGRDRAQRIELKVVLGYTFRWLSPHDLEVQLVSLGHSADCRRAWVALQD